jgi:arylsulfatase
MLFTDSYGEQSCTAGARRSSPAERAAHRPVQGRHPGLADRHERQDRDDRRAAQGAGLRTGQFGKNHLGDLNHMLPTNHGFDEFFGNLYHLNAEEEPEMDDYPKDPSSARSSGRAA